MTIRAVGFREQIVKSIDLFLPRQITQQMSLISRLAECDLDTMPSQYHRRLQFSADNLGQRRGDIQNVECFTGVSRADSRPNSRGNKCCGIGHTGTLFRNAGPA